MSGYSEQCAVHATSKLPMGWQVANEDGNYQWGRQVANEDGNYQWGWQVLIDLASTITYRMSRTDIKSRTLTYTYTETEHVKAVQSRA